MFRKGYIYVIHNNMVESKNAVVYYNKEFIYFKVNGDNKLHWCAQARTISKERFEKLDQFNMEADKYYFVFVTHEDEPFHFNENKSFAYTQAINKYQHKIRGCNDQIAYWERKINEVLQYRQYIEEHKKNIQYYEAEIAKLREKIDELKTEE